MVCNASKSLASDAVNQINVGIIGLGGRGNRIREILAGMPGVKVVALCDADRERFVGGLASACRTDV